MSAYTDALKLLARRELSEKELRDRLVDRGHPADEINRVVEHLLETKSLDDGRVARAYARTAANVKGRGRLRVMRELSAMGIAREGRAGISRRGVGAPTARGAKKSLAGREEPVMAGT